MVERSVRTPGSGPTGSVAILPADTRVRDLRVHAVRNGRSRTLPLGAARAGSSRSTATPSSIPTGSR
jgi:hypothetical protein